MATPRNPTRQRLVQAALELFAQQGITETTTKQIAELAGVNEVTLFRQFGTKQGLVLAILEDTTLFDRLATQLAKGFDRAKSPEQGLEQYAQAYLRLFDAVPDMLRSIVGEAGKYPPENREALGRGIYRANELLANCFQEPGKETSKETGKETGKEAGQSWVSNRALRLIHCTLLGYAVLESTTQSHGLWSDRAAFVQDLVQLALGQSIAPAHPNSTALASASLSGPLSTPLENRDRTAFRVMDLSAPLVHEILRRAQKAGAREGALVYLLFGAGVSPAEIIRLERVHHWNDRDSQFLQITQGAVRQVPVNQWIMGKRYGTYLKNPLTQWLKSRQDDQGALITSAASSPLTLADIYSIWQPLTRDLQGVDGQAIAIEQAQQTWCVDLLVRGMTLEAMQILTGMTLEQLAPHSQRARERVVLEQGLALDKR